MRLIVSILFSAFILHSAFSQEKTVEIKPLIGFNGSLNTGWGEILLADYNAHVGLSINRQIFVAFNTGASFPVLPDSHPRYYHYWTSSLTLRARIIDNYRKVNPVFQLNGGFGYRNKSQQVYISSHHIDSQLYYYTSGIFDKVGLFGSMQFGADLNLGNFQLVLSGGIQRMNMDYIVEKQSPDHIRVKGVGFIVSLASSYMLNFNRENVH